MPILHLIANGLAPLTLIGAMLAYFMPEAFLIFGSIFKWLFAATMFALGVVLEPKELNDTLKHLQRIGLEVPARVAIANFPFADILAGHNFNYSITSVPPITFASGGTSTRNSTNYNEVKGFFRHCPPP